MTSVARWEALCNQSSPAAWWMIERHDCSPHEYFALKYGKHTWTPDWTLGERFPTKEAAEAHTNGDPLLHVIEHAMMDQSSPASSEDGQ